MDRKATLILVVATFLLIVWYPLTNYLFPPLPVPKNTNALPRSISGTNGGAAISQTNLAEAQPEIRAPRASTRAAVPSGPEQLLSITNENARYVFTSRGGGLKTIELSHYSSTIDCRSKPKPGSHEPVQLNAPAPAPVLSIWSRDSNEDETYALTPMPNGIRAEKQLTNGLTIVKNFQLSTNYLLNASVRIENNTGQAIRVGEEEWVLGTATPIGQRDESLSLGIQWYNGQRDERVDQAYFANRSFGCLPGTPRELFEAGQNNVVWAAVDNQFFTLVAVPNQPAARMIGRKIDLPPPEPKALAENPHLAAIKAFGYQAAFAYPAGTIPAHGKIERQFLIYAGPKEYKTLSRLGNDLDLVMNFGGFFGFFAKALLLGMNGLNALGLKYGFAIIVITIVIKLVFWPLTQASTRSMKRMQTLQPQMKALQEKYKDDPKKMQMKLMEFMKEHKVSPLGGCLPMLLQIPVFFGFYRMLRTAIELRGASFLWACDLSQPDTVATIPGLNFPINPLPLLMGATMLWQSSLTPPSPGVDPVQQKMMRYMPLMMMVFLYNFSAGLTLYWTVQNLLTIAQMKLTKSIDPASPAGPKAGVPTPKFPPPKRKS